MNPEHLPLVRAELDHLGVDALAEFTRKYAALGGSCTTHAELRERVTTTALVAHWCNDPHAHAWTALLLELDTRRRFAALTDDLGDPGDDAA